MFPRNNDSPRAKELQAIVSAAGANWTDWPAPRPEDYELVGRLVVLFCYVDFNLRRIAEIFEREKLLGLPWSRVANLNMTDTAKAVLSASIWSVDDRQRLLNIEEYRRLRNLCAHCAIRRFPVDDAFAFFFISARDFKREFGAEPESGIAVNVTMEAKVVRTTVSELLRLQEWLAQRAAEIGVQYSQSRAEQLAK